MTDDLRQQHRVLSPAEEEKVQAVKDAGQKLLDLADELTPSTPSIRGRCFAIGKTKTEEAVMWIVKGITA